MKEEYKPGYLKLVHVTCDNDKFENAIRMIGVGNACEYFGHSIDSEFTRETFDWLKDKGETK